MRAVDVALVVDDERAALAADEVLRLVEAQRREATEAAERLAAVRAEQPVRVVLDEVDVAVGDRRLDAVDVAADAGVVDRHDGADGVVRSSVARGARVEAERLALDVAEERAGALAREGERGRDERERRHDDGVAGPEVEQQRASSRARRCTTW